VLQLNAKHHISEKVTKGLLHGLDAINKALTDSTAKK
jgi:hypothetical protein